MNSICIYILKGPTGERGEREKERKKKRERAGHAKICALHVVVISFKFEMLPIIAFHVSGLCWASRASAAAELDVGPESPSVFFFVVFFFFFSFFYSFLLPINRGKEEKVEEKKEMSPGLRAAPGMVLSPSLPEKVCGFEDINAMMLLGFCYCLYLFVDSMLI